MTLNNYRKYLFEILKLRREFPQCFDLLQLLKFFPAWNSSLNGKASPLTDEQPWITFAAIEFLKQILTKDMRVFEYGTGGSTLFFAKRVKEVISIEHDCVWSQKVIDLLEKKKYKNVKISLIEPKLDELSIGKDPSDPNAYISSSYLFSGYSFENYSRSIDMYPDGYFDLIVIDGRSRPSCFVHSLPKLKTGGYILWDNTDRNYYYPSMQNAPNHFDFIDFPGPSPYVNSFTRTSVWCAKRE